MFSPGVSIKVKLVGIAVLAIFTASLVGTALAAINQVVAEGHSEAQFSRGEAASFAGIRRPASDEHAVVTSLKFVCPFH